MHCAGTRGFPHQLVPQRQFAYKHLGLPTEGAMKRRAVAQSQMTDQVPSFVACEAGSRPPSPSQKKPAFVPMIWQQHSELVKT
eukprot:153621-Pelagomonas_calceolata.AAC.2